MTDVRPTPLFATPFLQVQMAEDFRQRMLNFLFSNFDFNQISQSHYDNNLFDLWPSNQEILELKKISLDLAEQLLQQPDRPLFHFQRAWICGTGYDYHMTNHNHANSAISMVLYFQAEEGGDVIFKDPRTNANRGYSSKFKKAFGFQDYSFAPKSGDIIVFPSFLYHSVPPYKGKSVRAAIAIDLFAET